jgi:hypothetical protein
MNKEHPSLLNMLVNRNILDDSLAKTLENYSKTWDVSAFRAVLDCHIMAESALADLLAEELGIGRVFSIEKDDFSSDAFKHVSYREALAWELVPLGTDDVDRYAVIMADPTDLKVINELAVRTKKSSSILICERRVLRHAIDEFYPIELQIPSLVHTNG